MQKLVCSRELQNIRHRLDKDRIYLCFYAGTSRTHRTQSWFTFRRSKDNPAEDEFAATDVVPTDHQLVQTTKDIFAVGPEIVFVGGQFGSATTVWQFDTRTTILRQAPTMPAELQYRNSGVLGNKLYVFGTRFTAENRRERYQTQAATFDLSSETWAAPFPMAMKMSLTTVSIDNQIYLIKGGHFHEFYNPLDGSNGNFDMPYGINEFTWSPTGVCVMNNLLYFYDITQGLLWYNSTHRSWKEVSGSTMVKITRLRRVRWVALSKYYGKLALLWSDEKQIWASMIDVERVGSEIHGVVEEFQHLPNMPWEDLTHCVSVSV